MSDASSLHYRLKNKQLKLKAFSSKDPAKGVVFNNVHLGGVWLLLPYD